MPCGQTERQEFTRYKKEGDCGKYEKTWWRLQAIQTKLRYQEESEKSDGSCSLRLVCMNQMCRYRCRAPFIITEKHRTIKQSGSLPQSFFNFPNPMSLHI